MLVWGYHYPALERLGFSLEALKALNPNSGAGSRVCVLEPPVPRLIAKDGSNWRKPPAERSSWLPKAEGRTILSVPLPCDFGTGYLGAIGTMSALRQRPEQGGFWNVEASLTGTII